jgi:hypothetical protein
MLIWPSVPTQISTPGEGKTHWVVSSYYIPTCTTKCEWRGLIPAVRLADVDPVTITKIVKENDNGHKLAQIPFKNNKFPVCKCGELLAYRINVMADHQTTFSLKSMTPWECFSCGEEQREPIWEKLSAHELLKLFHKIQEKTESCLLR